MFTFYFVQLAFEINKMLTKKVFENEKLKKHSHLLNYSVSSQYIGPSQHFFRNVSLHDRCFALVFDFIWEYGYNSSSN